LESQPGKWWKRSKGSGWSLNLGVDISVLLPALALSLLGVAMVYSATQAKPEMAHLYLKQLTWIGIGCVGMLFFSSLNYQVLMQRYAYPAYWALVVLLAILLAAGQEVAGSKRWMSLGPVSLQPSEFAKIATTLVLAKYLSSRQDRVRSWDTVVGAFLLGGLPMLLILKEPDLGTALLFMTMVFVLLYTVGVPLKRLLTIVGGGILASPLIWMMLKEYQRKRLMVFLNPNADTLGSGYNVIQSKIAIGSGQLMGKGWLAGTQGQLKFVPEHHTDFIFSVLAEEWGFVGSVALLVLFLIFILQALRVARGARDLQGQLIAIGLTTILAAQVLINLGVATGILPATGITLPLISYGGSSLLTTYCIIGILMNIWSNRIVK
jgi:rod shape determining protein RodA